MKIDIMDKYFCNLRKICTATNERNFQHLKLNGIKVHSIFLDKQQTNKECDSYCKLYLYKTIIRNFLYITYHALN